jgi:hypothetical protein
MNLDYLREKKELIVNSAIAAYFKSQSPSVLLLCVSAFLGILILVKVSGFFVATARAETLVKQALANGKPDTKEMEKHLAKYREVADGLKKKNLFAPPPPKQHPVKEVSGIMGDEVLIEGKWYKVGDMVADAKIVAIEPARVRIEWDGNEKVFLPIDAAIPVGPKGPKPKPDAEAAKAEKGEAATVVQVQLEVKGGEDMGMFSEEDMEGFRGMRERWGNMSEEEREQFRARMRGRPGGRRPPGEGPRGGRRE